MNQCEGSHAAAAGARCIHMFYSYAHEDEAFVRELEKQLSVLKRTGVLTTWYDRNIGAGQEWEQRILDQLAAAQVIVLMVSPDFVASDYCWERELFTAMTRHRLGTAVVVPIVLRATANLELTPFGKLQMLPKDAMPVAQWPHPDQVWAEVAQSLSVICIELQTRVIAEDRIEAQRIYAEIAADAKRLRPQREALMRDLQQHIFEATPESIAGLKPLARHDPFSAYIDGACVAPGELDGGKSER